MFFPKVNPMATTIETIETRVSEIESIFLMGIDQDSRVLQENLALILQHKNSFEEICSKIDNLELFVERVKSDLLKLETQIARAKEELDIPEKKIDIFFKSFNIFTAQPKPESNLKDGSYDIVDICNTKDYFCD